MKKIKIIILCLLVNVILNAQNNNAISVSLDKYSGDQLYKVLKYRMESKQVNENKNISHEYYDIGNNLYSDSISVFNANYSFINELDNIPSDTIFKIMRKKYKSIYGPDDRKDIFEIKNPEIKENEKKVLGFIEIKRIKDNGNGTSSIIYDNYKERYYLCDEEPFINQPICAFCTGFPVSRNIVATAGHCVNQSNYRLFKLVFGFEMQDSVKAITIINNSDIFNITKVIVSLTNDTTDFALIRVDREIPEYRINKCRLKGKIDNDQEVYVIGHPCGLPIKVAGNANVRNNIIKNFFIANLDTYGGNSGSPVYNSNTHIVEGILVQGDSDFILLDNCYRSNVCPNTGCSGEVILRTSQFTKYLINEK